MAAKNPFRKKPLNVQLSLGDCDKSKFKHTKFGNNGKRHSVDTGGNRKFNNRKWKKFDKEKKEGYTFNEVAKNAKPESATPWSKYMDEIAFIHREEKQAALRANMESVEAKIALKNREIKYRKSLIEQSKREPTEWDDFGEEEEGIQKNDSISKNNSSNDSKLFYSNEQYKNSKKMQMNKQKNEKKELNTQYETSFKKNISNSERKADKEFISKELMENFDSKKLTYEQNNKLRAAITKTAFLASGGSLQNVVNDLKRKKIKKEKLNKKYNN